MVRDARDVEALVLIAVAQNWDVEHGWLRQSFNKITGFARLTRYQYTPSTTALWKREKGRTLRTPSHGYSSQGGSRSASSRSRKRGMKNSFVRVVKRTRPVWPYSTIRSGSSGSTTSTTARGTGG